MLRGPTLASLLEKAPRLRDVTGSLPSPRLSGLALRSLAVATRSPAAAYAVYQVLRAELGVSALAQLPAELRGPAGAQRVLQGRPPRQGDDLRLDLIKGPWSGSSEDYLEAYRKRKVTPTEVVGRALANARALGSRKPSVGPILDYAEQALREAELATDRYRAGAPRGSLDGVPFVVKEELAVRGLPRRGGTAILDGTPCTRDATLVERLRAAGAIVLGTTMMTEYGLSPVGFNPQRVMPRNPHGLHCATGGSSSGTAVAVATGLVPFGIGGDGGGSIRIPAAACGVFGLKATWGRVSRAGDVYEGTVEHLGPLASSTLDLARCLEIVSPPDERDAETQGAPPVERGALVKALGRGVKGLRVAVFEAEWADADAAVQRACEGALLALEEGGAILVRRTARLTPHAAAVGYLLLPMDACAALRSVLLRHREGLGADVQVILSAMTHTPASDYIDVLKLRAGLRREMQQVFQDVDLVAYPTLRRTALRLTDDELSGGILDGKAVDAMCRYTFLANLTGLPAGTAPVGHDGEGLPIGFQLVGDAWDEATVLAGLGHLERSGVASATRPGVDAPSLPLRGTGGMTPPDRIP